MSLLLAILTALFWSAIFVRATELKVTDSFAFLAVSLCFGLCGLGLESWLLGSLQMLSAGVFAGVATLQFAIVLWLFRPYLLSLRLAILDAWSQLKEPRWASIFCAVILLLLCFSALFRPPAVDELEYHFSAPLAWANHGGFFDTGKRFSLNFCLAEFIYSLPACFGSLFSARMSHLAFLFAALLAVASLARTLCSRPSIAVLAALACPTLVTQSALAYNDTAWSACIMSALVFLFGQKLMSDDERKQSDTFTAKGFDLSLGLLLAFACSIKPLAAAPAALIVGWRIYSLQKIERLSFQPIASLLLPGLLILGLWLCHAQSVGGTFFQTNGFYLASAADDPQLLSGAAAGRMPSLKDLLILPVLPLILGVVGQAEPYGGRVGFLPLFLALSYLMQQSTRTLCRRAVWPLIVCIGSWLVVGPFFIKTRFHDLFWMTSATLAGASTNSTALTHITKMARWMTMLFFLLVSLGLADLVRSLALPFL